MQKALIYCRVSSQQQSSEGHGLDSQEHRCREYVARKGYEVAEVFRDSFTGGGDFMKRPAMAKLLAYLDSKPHEEFIVIFDDLKRFARDAQFHLKLRAVFRARGVKLECLNYNFDESPEGQFVELIFAGQAELEREQNRRQVVQKQKACVEAGYWIFPAPPAYRRVKQKGERAMPVIYKPEVEIVREALQGFASGRFSDQTDVQRFLQERRIKGDKRVYLDYVKRILQHSLLYAGWIEYKPWEISLRKGEHGPVIDWNTHLLIQDRLSGKIRHHKMRMINPDFPLRGFVLCHQCRQPMTASWSTGRNGKFPYYRCRTKGCLERNKSVAREKIGGEFGAILASIKPSESVLNLTKAIVADLWSKKEQEMKAGRRELEMQLAQVRLERNKLLERITKAADEKVIALYETKISELTEKEAVLKESVMSFEEKRPNIETALEIVFDFLKNPLVQWQKGDIHQKKLVLKLVFEEKLAYNKNSGFETAILSLPLRVFCLPEAQKTRLVDLARIELAPRQCE